MATKRVPIDRPVRMEITPRAVRLWEQMQRLECTCAPRDWDGAYWGHELCAGCEKRGQLKGGLHRELQLRPWEDAVSDPDALNPYPVGTYAHEHFERDRDAEARWRTLEAASKELRRAKRLARRRLREPELETPAPAEPRGAS